MDHAGEDVASHCVGTEWEARAVSRPDERPGREGPGIAAVEQRAHDGRRCHHAEHAVFDRRHVDCGVMRILVATDATVCDEAALIVAVVSLAERGMYTDISSAPGEKRCVMPRERSIDIIVALGQMKTKSRISDSVFGVTAVDVIAGKLCVITKVLPVRSTIDAVAICPA